MVKVKLFFLKNWVFCQFYDEGDFEKHSGVEVFVATNTDGTKVRLRVLYANSTVYC